MRVQWPSGVVEGESASWQAAIDRHGWARPMAELGALSLSILVVVAGLLGLYLLWYRTGRDAPAKVQAEWIPEPPGDMPPGMVGTLLDERAGTREVLATQVDLARREVIG